MTETPRRVKVAMVARTPVPSRTVCPHRPGLGSRVRQSCRHGHAETGCSVFSSRRTRPPPRTVEPVLMVAKNALSWCLSRRDAVSKASVTGGADASARIRMQARLNASRRRASAQKNTCRLTCCRQHSGHPANLPASVGINRRSGICCGRRTATPPLSKVTETKVSRFSLPSRKTAAGSKPVSLSQGPAPSASITCQTTG